MSRHTWTRPKLIDPITGEEVPPNEKLMRSMEQKVQVPEHGKDSFRNEIFRKVAMANRHGEKFDYTTHEKLKEAIEKQLFEERRDTIKLTIRHAVRIPSKSASSTKSSKR